MVCRNAARGGWRRTNPFERAAFLHHW
jgi:hypothetical protein